MPYFTWLRTPKTAGTSIEKSLEEAGLLARERYIEGRVTMVMPGQIGRFIREYKEIYDDSVKFAVVRNPWDRMISGWRYIWPDGSRSLEQALSDPPRPHDFWNWHHFTQQQTDFLLDSQGKLIPGWLIRFENLAADLNAFLASQGLPEISLRHDNSSKRKPGYHQYFCDRTRYLAQRRFRRDIRLLPYEY